MKDIERRKFINSALCVFGLANLGPGVFEQPYVNGLITDQSARRLTLKGKVDSTVKHWDIITIGNLSRNRYWGESEERQGNVLQCNGYGSIKKEYGKD